MANGAEGAAFVQRLFAPLERGLEARARGASERARMQLYVEELGRRQRERVEDIAREWQIRKQDMIVKLSMRRDPDTGEMVFDPKLYTAAVKTVGKIMPTPPTPPSPRITVPPPGEITERRTDIEAQIERDIREGREGRREAGYVPGRGFRVSPEEGFYYPEEEQPPVMTPVYGRRQPPIPIPQPVPEGEPFPGAISVPGGGWRIPQGAQIGHLRKQNQARRRRYNLSPLEGGFRSLRSQPLGALPY